MTSQDSHLSDALRWAIEDDRDAAMAAADWLARDIDPVKPSAAALLTDQDASLATLRRAKDVYKTMRIIGETSADRRVGARLYVASIAAAMVRHDAQISRQSARALRRGFQSLQRDTRMPSGIRLMATSALRELHASD